MIFPFQPNSFQNQVFNPVLDGVTYVATIEWNIFGQRWYLNLSDGNGNLIVYKAVVSSQDQQSLAALTWDRGVVTATTTAPHGIPVGRQAILLIQGNTPAAYNGIFLVTSQSPTEFTYEISTDPGALVQLGTSGGFVDLTAGLFQTSVFLYFASNSSFVVLP